MNQLRRWLAIGSSVLAIAACQDRETKVAAQPDRPDVASPPPAADNTGQNVRDREGALPTPTDQSNDERDLQITRQIRDAITSNDALGTNARNVKVITQGSNVVLRGPVSSPEEKATIERIARSTAGVSSVQNQLEIAPGS